MSLLTDLLNGVGGLLEQATRASSSSGIGALVSKINPIKLGVLLLNSAIVKNPQIKGQLDQYSGKILCVRILNKIHYFRVMGGTGLEYIDGAQAYEPNVTLTLDNSVLFKIPSLLADGISIDDLTELMHIEGEAGLAKTLAELVVLLKESGVAELSNTIGPLAAGTIFEGLRKSKELSSSISNKGFERAREFMSKDIHVTVTRNEFLELKYDIQDLDHRLEKLNWKLKTANSVVEDAVMLGE